MTCAPACPPTCDSIHAGSSCKTSVCVEGCACDDGFVQSDERCVPISECGCKDTNNHYHPVGERWLTKHCTQICVCKKGGEVTCTDSGCGLNEVCSLTGDGQYACKPTGFSKCTVGGSPYYLAFDGRFHHFAGENQYTLAETTGIPDRLQEFRILGKNAPQKEKQIIIEVYGHTVQLKEKRRLVVDGEMVKPPIQLHDGLQIYQRSYRLHLETDFGLTVSFDENAHADITLPNNYIKWVRGLCSNFDGTSKNNLMQSDGTGNMKRPTTDENVESGFDLQCSERELRLIDSNSYCGIISDPDGPFSNCHRIISPEQYRLNCIFSLCSVRNITEVLCINLEQYALHCQEQGVALGEWRKDNRCEMVCPDNSQYNMQMPSCPASCANFGAPSECESPTVEGCDCLPGFVLSDFHCVPYKTCGCTYRTKYYEVGEKFITEDCSEACECVNTGIVDCMGLHCAPGTTCTIADHTRGCF
ncbi:zonadhesin-like [Rhinoraja longicauda]